MDKKVAKRLARIEASLTSSSETPAAFFAEAASGAARIACDAPGINDRRAASRALLAAAAKSENALHARMAALEALVEVSADVGGFQDVLSLEVAWPSPLRRCIAEGGVRFRLPADLGPRLIDVAGAEEVCSAFCEAAKTTPGLWSASQLLETALERGSASCALSAWPTACDGIFAVYLLHNLLW
ncbi:unnamed protein product [Effrenium voratum]|nr:unnamed protein product [Effrenium voratum]